MADENEAGGVETVTHGNEASDADVSKEDATLGAKWLASIGKLFGSGTIPGEESAEKEDETEEATEKEESGKVDFSQDIKSLADALKDRSTDAVNFASWKKEAEGLCDELNRLLGKSKERAPSKEGERLLSMVESLQEGLATAKSTDEKSQITGEDLVKGFELFEKRATDANAAVLKSVEELSARIAKMEKVENGGKGESVSKRGKKRDDAVFEGAMGYRGVFGSARSATED